MPVNYSYIENRGLLLKGTGTIVAEDILEVNRSIYATPEMIKKIRYQICDYTTVDNWQISPDDILRIAEQDKRAAEVNPTMLIAVAAEEDLAFGLSRMWDIQVGDDDLQVYVFRTVVECKEWIESQLKKGQP